uniref:Ig-like domain-containing protein n=1 Tax=Anopheles atroparvus TaxID=41427 RepID=A0AAG5DTW7_ANOAO
MFWRSRRRSRTSSQLAKWCTIFIIFEFTNVGSDLITSTTSNMVTTAGSWMQNTTPHPTVPHGYAGPTHLASSVPSGEPQPRFEALVQESPLEVVESKGKTFPLLKETIPSSTSFERTVTTASGSTSHYVSSKSSDVKSIGETGKVSKTHLRPTNTDSTTTSKSIPVGSSAAVGSSFSKITSANLILAEGGNREPGKIGPGQKVPAGFTTSSSSSSSSGSKAYTKTNPRASAPSELEPSGNINRLDTSDASVAEGNVSKMYFETDNHTRIASQVGSIAVLPCAVRNIGEGVVSWIRRKDYHLLTIGFTTYSSDERFNIIHSDDTEEWPLQIKYVQLRDAGLYECQVSTHPPTSIFVKLDVVEAKAEIFGPSEKYLKPGSMLRLTCRVVQSNEPPLYIFWYHNSRMINYDTHRGVNVSTEADNRYSELVITHTNTLNSGNYSCVSNNAVAASTLVHILNGENPAAMQHGDHGNAVLVASQMHLPLAVVTYQVICFILRIFFYRHQ